MHMIYPKFLEDTINKYDNLSKDQNLKFIKEYKKSKDKKIKEKIILGNLKLISFFHNKLYSNISVSHCDLFMECIAALDCAIEQYDVNSGKAFATFAHYKIRHASNRYLTKHAYAVKVSTKIAETSISNIFKNDPDIKTIKDLKKKYPKYNNISDDGLLAYIMYNYVEIDTINNGGIYIDEDHEKDNNLYMLLYKILLSRIDEIDSESIDILGMNKQISDLISSDNKLKEFEMVYTD